MAGEIPAQASARPYCHAAFIADSGPAAVSEVTTARDLALVMIAHKWVEQPHAPARAPALVDIGLRRAHRRAGDVEMRPRRRADETLEELRRRDRTAVTAAGILHVGELRVDHL